jgi:hypothetical protein
LSVKTYDGKIIKAYVYSKPVDTKRNSEIDKDPSERYLDILMRTRVA